MTRGRAPQALAGAVLALGSSGLVGCTARSDPAPAPVPAPTRAEVPDPGGLDVRTRVTRVAGALSDTRRRQLSRSARTLVTDYVEAAYLDGNDDGNAVLPGFTLAARRLARRDLDVLSAAGFPGADSVRARSARPAQVYVAAVAANGRAVGATARVSIHLAVTRDGATAPARLRGRLLLTPTDRGWRIFGYDLALSGAGAGSTKKGAAS